MKKKSFFLICLYILLISINSFSQEFSLFKFKPANSLENETKNSPFTVDLLTDSILLSTSLSLNVLNLSLDKFTDIKTKIKVDPLPYNSDLINKFDSLLFNPYSEKLDRTGDIFLVSSALFACSSVLLAPKGNLLTNTLMLAETFLLANGIKDSLKLIVNRPRPYMYFENPPQEDLIDGDWCCSWPSGHTTLAFTAASFASYTFWKNYPKSPWRFAVTAVSFSLATTTGILRIASGNHFMTDVFTGAIIGTACGILVPFLHTLKIEYKTVSASANPLGISLCIKF